MKASHGGRLGKKSDWLGKEAEGIKGELKFSKKRNWEFNKKSGPDKTWNWCQVSAGRWRQCWAEKRKSQVQETD